MLTTTWYMIGRRNHVVKPVACPWVGSHRIEEGKDGTWTLPVSSYTRVSYRSNRTMRRNRNPRKRGEESPPIFAADSACTAQQTSKQSHAQSNWPLWRVPNPPEKDNSQFRMSQTARTWAERVFRWTSLAFPAFLFAFRRRCQGPFSRFAHCSVRSKSKKRISGKVGCCCCQEVSGIMWLFLGFYMFHVL